MLPEIEKKLIDLLATFMKADSGSFHDWEIMVTIPGVNTFIQYMHGVNISLKEDNYVSASANLRGMLEVLGAIVYDGTAKLPREVYTIFMRSGRLPKWDAEDKK